MRALLLRAVIAIGFIAAACACVYVPYSAVADIQGRKPVAFVGYGLLWQPPETETACFDAFKIGNPHMCQVKISTVGVALGVLAIGFLFAGLAVAAAPPTTRLTTRNLGNMS